MARKNKTKPAYTFINTRIGEATMEAADQLLAIRSAAQMTGMTATVTAVDRLLKQVERVSVALDRKLGYKAKSEAFAAKRAETRAAQVKALEEKLAKLKGNK